MSTTPIHWIQLTCSNKMNEDKVTATGSSEATKIVPSPGPICGIPIENNSGGRATPNNPSNSPYGATPDRTEKSNKNVGGYKVKTTIKEPVDMSALFCTGGVSFSIEPLTKIEVVNEREASKPQSIPSHEGMVPSCETMFAAKAEPIRSIIMETSFSLVGRFL